MRVHKTPWLRRLGVLVGIASLSGGLIIAAPVRPAGADEIADKKAQAARIAAQVEAEGEKVSILAERLNEARLHADKVQAELNATQVEVARTEAQVANATKNLKTHMVSAYIKGGHVSALQMLVGGKGEASSLAVRTSYVKAVAGKERTALDALAVAKEQSNAKQAALSAVKKDATSALKAVEADRKAAAGAEANAKATLGQVQGELADLVAAEARRRAEEAQRRAQAELAARQAREAAARNQPAPGGNAGPNSPNSPARRPPSPVADPGPAPAPNPGAQKAVDEAKRQLGKPYEYGAGGPDSYDCSGLTSWAWRAGGVSLPHSSRAQYSATHRVAVGDIQPGDLVFYGNPIHHVGIYVGNGTMVEASQTGTPVRYASIYRSDLVGVGRVG
jgi:cell wall-associated NlpC family hydrolase